MVQVDLKIAPRFNTEVEETVRRQLGQHVIEEWDLGLKRVSAHPVQIELHRYIGLRGLPAHLCCPGHYGTSAPFIHLGPRTPRHALQIPPCPPFVKEGWGNSAPLSVPPRIDRSPRSCPQ